MDLQKKSFIEPVESCPHWLKITLLKDLGHIAQKYRIAIQKNIFPNILSNMFLDFISYVGVIDHDIKNKIENLRLQECSLKSRSSWKLVIFLETYKKRRQ